ncbi:MAG TPA: HAD family hydrolase, partial [Dehalococcoidia bacterium]|nr:HAD family hydrolase [Dehalococcoidia bacterium]
MTALVLFDIDNTLLYTGGAGSAAMRLAFADVFGIPDGFAKVEFQGRTDRLILRDALRIHGLPDAALDARFDDFRAAYLVHLARLLEEYEGHLKPGLPDLLECLSRAGLRLGLATGNVREGAFRKLRHYGLDGYFERGG